MQRQIEDACRKGLNFFDMGAGDPHDRNEWCDIEVPLFKSALAFDERGYIVTASSALMDGAKRFIRTRPAISSFAQDIRRTLHGAMGLPRHQFTP